MDEASSNRNRSVYIYIYKLDHGRKEVFKKNVSSLGPRRCGNTFRCTLSIYIWYAEALLNSSGVIIAPANLFFCLMRSKSLLRPCQVCGEGKEKPQAAKLVFCCFVSEKSRQVHREIVQKDVLKGNGRSRWRCVTFGFPALLSKPLYSIYRIKVKSNFQEQTFFTFTRLHLSTAAENTRAFRFLL